MGDPRRHPFHGTQFFNFKNDTPSRDADAHLMARALLLDLLDHDDAVIRLFHTFEGLWSSAENFARLADVFARQCGWRDRAEMYTSPELHDETRSPHCDTFMALGYAFPWYRLSTFHAAAAVLVHDTWSLPRHDDRENWAWLSADLLQSFALQLEGMMLGRGHLVVYGKHGSPPAASERKGAYVDEARLRRDVEWFYRRHLHHPPESLAALARGYHETEQAHGISLSPDQKHIVKTGIARARRLLSEISG
jgi:hypothetical protein